jgi:hypothetical protein
VNRVPVRFDRSFVHDGSRPSRTMAAVLHGVLVDFLELARPEPARHETAAGGRR